MPDLEVDPKTSPVGKATSTETAPVAKSKAPEAPPPESSGLGGQRIAALVVGGVGVVGTAVGGYFALRARAANDRAQCDASGACKTQQDINESDQAIKLANYATYSATGGLIALAAGVVLWVTAPSKPSTDSASVTAPRRLWISADPLGETGTRSVTVGGAF